MLVLSRKVGERIVIGDNITVVVQRVSGGRVSLAIEAPQDVRILRGELDPFGDGPPRRPESAKTPLAEPQSFPLTVDGGVLH